MTIFESHYFTTIPALKGKELNPPPFGWVRGGRKPEIFRMTPDEFKNNVINLQDDLINSGQQRCET